MSDDLARILADAAEDAATQQRKERELEWMSNHSGAHTRVEEINALTAELSQVRAELREARLDARVLAHAYERGGDPPANVVKRSLEWTVRGEDPAVARALARKP
jgi:hypothetical protein